MGGIFMLSHTQVNVHKEVYPVLEDATKRIAATRGCGTFQCKLLVKKYMIDYYDINKNTGGKEMTFGEKLLKLRSDAGFSQDKLAEMLDVSRQSVSKWERDEAMPDTEKIVLISTVFSVSTDSLLKDETDLAAETEKAEGVDSVRTERAVLDQEEAEKQDDAKRFERGSLMDFLDEVFKVIKNHFSLLGVFVAVTQIAGVIAAVFNGAGIYDDSDFDRSFAGILYNSMHTGSVGALIGILIGIAIIIAGVSLRRKEGAEDE